MCWIVIICSFDILLGNDCMSFFIDGNSPKTQQDKVKQYQNECSKPENLNEMKVNILAFIT